MPRSIVVMYGAGVSAERPLPLVPREPSVPFPFQLGAAATTSPLYNFTLDELKKMIEDTNKRVAELEAALPKRVRKRLKKR